MRGGGRWVVGVACRLPHGALTPGRAKERGSVPPLPQGGLWDRGSGGLRPPRSQRGQSERRASGEVGTSLPRALLKREALVGQV